MTRRDSFKTRYEFGETRRVFDETRYVFDVTCRVFDETHHVFVMTRGVFDETRRDSTMIYYEKGVFSYKKRKPDLFKDLPLIEKGCLVWVFSSPTMI